MTVNSDDLLSTEIQIDLLINAKANIFGAGKNVPPDPGGGGGGILPVEIDISNWTDYITFSNVIGAVDPWGYGSYNGPDGGTSFYTDLNSYEGISGIIHGQKYMFLVGVFLTDSIPSDPAPQRLDFSTTDNFAELSPSLNQTFFIGDGLTGTGEGTTQKFFIPVGATRLYLGLADGYSFLGDPGWYDDNVGQFSVSVNGVEAAHPNLWIDKQHTASSGDTVTIPVNCSDLTGLSIYSVGIFISYDSTILEAIDANLSGTVVDPLTWGVPTTNIEPGQILIAMAGTTPISGNGKLINIVFQVKGNADDSTTLHFEHVILNEGDPIASTSDGLLRVIGYYIKGNLYYYSSSSVAVNNATVFLTGEVNQNYVSDAQGYYEFLNLPSGNYTVTPEKDGDQKNAISPYDASFILRYYVGTMNLTPYQYTAADVSGNGDITPYDASYILRYCVGAIPEFPVGADWRFIVHDFPIDDTNWTNASGYRSYNPLESNQDDQDFIGILYGDVSGNWVGSTNSGSNVIAQLRINDIHRTNNKKWLVPISMSCCGIAYSGKFKLLVNNTDLKFESGMIENFSSDELIFAIHSAGGEISFAFASAQPLNNQEIKINLLFEELETVTPVASDFEFVDVTIDDKNTTVTVVENESIHELPVDWQLSQNQPNPFNPETNITYQVPKTSLVKIEVFNLLGQRIKTLVNEEKNPGTYQINWNGLDDQGKSVVSGIYLYRIQSQSFNQMKRMILLR